jgi:nucleotide-binding universal stress UspA family protein
MTTASADIWGRTPLASISNHTDVASPLRCRRRQDPDRDVMTRHELGLHDLDGVDDAVTVDYYGPSIHRAIDEILVPVAGGPNTDAVLGLAGNLASSWDASVTLLTVLPEDADSEHRRAAEARLEDYTGEFDGVRVETRLETGEDVVAIITALTDRFELVVIGDSEQSLFGRFFTSSIPDRLDRDSQAPIFVVSR